tara:strand:- start:99 stop:434 length:336 start_codon:yes stop_codon:yes gene_type:complete
MFTKRHYIAIAQIINFRLDVLSTSELPYQALNAKAQEIRFFINNFMYEFAKDNNLFDKEKFEKACYKNIRLSDKNFENFQKALCDLPYVEMLNIDIMSKNIMVGEPFVTYL